MIDIRAIVLRAMGDRPASQIARVSGVPYSTLTQWLAGDRSLGISSSHLDKLLPALGLELRVAPPAVTAPSPLRRDRHRRGSVYGLMVLFFVLAFLACLLVLGLVR